MADKAKHKAVTKNKIDNLVSFFKYTPNDTKTNIIRDRLLTPNKIASRVSGNIAFKILYNVYKKISPCIPDLFQHDVQVELSDFRPGAGSGGYLAEVGLEFLERTVSNTQGWPTKSLNFIVGGHGGPFFV